MARSSTIPLTPVLIDRCRELVILTAQKHEIPPVFITAHIRNPVADEARKEVQRVMIGEIGMRRSQVAFLFGRDLRRVRKSVLGV